MVSQSCLLHIINCESAWAIWDTLHEIFENKDKMSKHLATKMVFAQERCYGWYCISQKSRTLRADYMLGEPLSDSIAALILAFYHSLEIDRYRVAHAVKSDNTSHNGGAGVNHNYENNAFSMKINERRDLNWRNLENSSAKSLGIGKVSVTTH